MSMGDTYTDEHCDVGLTRKHEKLQERERVDILNCLFEPAK